MKKYGFDYVLQVVDDGENLHNDDEYTETIGKKIKTFVKFQLLVNFEQVLGEFCQGGREQAGWRYLGCFKGV